MEIGRQTEPFDPSDYDDPEEAAFERRRALSESARDLLVVDRVREWLLEK